MNKKDSLGDRMKNNYENRSKTFLTRRTPVIIRLDGKAFHTFTRGMKKPYDEILINVMQKTMLQLCKNIQGCKIGYTQSDEITLLLTDYDTLTTDAWFDYSVQKLCSVSASLATLYFNLIFEKEVRDYNCKDVSYMCVMHDKFHNAIFDSRCFNIPIEEVCNCFVWRQQDATRNAIEGMGQFYFSYKQLHQKSCNDIQEMLMTEHNINFNNERIDYKRGSCCYKNNEGIWIIDKEIPTFTQDREFVERWI